MQLDRDPLPQVAGRLVLRPLRAQVDSHAPAPSPPPAPKARLFLSYGRRDAEELADHLDQDLSLFGYEVCATSGRSARAPTSCARSRTVSAAPSSSWPCSAPTPSASGRPQQPRRPGQRLPRRAPPRPLLLQGADRAGHGRVLPPPFVIYWSPRRNWLPIDPRCTEARMLWEGHGTPVQTSRKSFNHLEFR